MQPFKLNLLILLCLANGCASRDSQDASTINGTLFGAAAGASIGEHNDNPLGGALIGATTGAIAGNIVGESLNKRNSAYEQKFQADQELLKQQTQQRHSDAVTIEQLLKMTRAGVGDDIIVGQIETRGTAQYLTTDDIIYLTRENVSPVVIKGYQSGENSTKKLESNTTRIDRTAEGPVVVERHYNQGYSPRYYPPTQIPRRTGIYFGVGN